MMDMRILGFNVPEYKPKHEAVKRPGLPFDSTLKLLAQLPTEFRANDFAQAKGVSRKEATSDIARLYRMCVIDRLDWGLYTLAKRPGPYAWLKNLPEEWTHHDVRTLLGLGEGGVRKRIQALSRAGLIEWTGRRLHRGLKIWRTK